MTPSKTKNTVFLTEKEAEHIRNTVKARLARCSDLQGQPRERRDLKDAVSQATGASLMADMGGASEDTLPALAVGLLYPPCFVPLQDLEPMKISDLEMDTHHRGRKLIVRRASPVCELSARSWTMVTDEMGDEIERLEVCLHKAKYAEEVLDLTKYFVIKEPYFTLTDEGEPTLRIDHPSDLVSCWVEPWARNSNLDNGSGGQAENVPHVEKIARMYKDRGNTALKQQEFGAAYAEYTEGLKLACENNATETVVTLAQDISRNRAHVNIILDQLDEARIDALNAIIKKDDLRSRELNSKAYFRAGCAAYNLGDFQEAKMFHEEQQKLTPGNKDAEFCLRRLALRFQEQDTGTYNFSKIRAGLSQSRPDVDAASFLRNTKVGKSPGRGRGLFVVRDIPGNGLILCEKAFCVVWGHAKWALSAMTYDVRDDKIRVSPVGLSRMVAQRLLGNPSHIKKVLDLFGDHHREGKPASKAEDGPVVDTFQIHDIVSRNAFGPGGYNEEDARRASTGLWLWAAYINHSCIANAKKEYLGDLMVLRATRPIKAGEEIFHSYDESSGYDARQAALKTTWGFECACALCNAEMDDAPALRKKRAELANDVNVFTQREPWANAKRLTIVKARRLARAIEATYDEERYNGVPRMASQKIQDWLAKASKS